MTDTYKSTFMDERVGVPLVWNANVNVIVKLDFYRKLANR